MTETETETEAGWRRLSVRVVYLDLLRVAISLVTGFAGITLRDDPVWPLVAGAAGGLLTALVDLRRWQTTRYRITPERVEMRTGRLARKHRTVARDRIRSVDSSARLLQRLFGLRTVAIGSGDAESSFRLDALDSRHSELVQRELMPGQTAEPSAPREVEPGETVITRLRRSWIPLNAFTVWAMFAVLGPLFALNWALRPFGVDLLAVGRDLAGWDSHGPAAGIALVLVIGYPLGVAAAAVAFVVENGNFALVRTGVAPHTALVTRRGLLTTKTVQRSDERIRGIGFSEPLLWRWLRVTRTKLLLTGSGAAGEGTGGDILPRTRLAEARELAPRILADGAWPLEAALRGHPRGALVRRLGWAVYWPVLLSAASLMFIVSGALPGWVWPLPLLLTPVTVPLAVVAYRALGHTVDGDYLVVRGGALSRETVALQRRAVIGWTVEQTIFQRWGGRVDVGVATAAGARHYTAPDMSTAQALAFIAEATPHLAAGIVPDAGGPVT